VTAGWQLTMMMLRPRREEILPYILSIGSVLDIDHRGGIGAAGSVCFTEGERGVLMQNVIPKAESLPGNIHL
jgi:hypothetical protein